MAYTINLTDGTIFATIADGTINTSSSMILVGKNYAGYGEFLDENFIHLLESGSNTTAPGAPLTGQLWWDKTTGVMKAYNGSTFKTLGTANAASSQPSGFVLGDLWFDTQNQQLKIYNGSGFILIGPASTTGQGTSGAIVATITDSLATDHVVVQLWAQNTIVAIVSKDATFTPQSAISGFATISPGIQLSSVVTNASFVGTASDADALGGLLSTQFLRSDANDTTSGTLGILNDTGLTVGLDQDAKISVNQATSEVALQNQTQDANLALKVNDGGVSTTVMLVDGATSVVTFPTTVSVTGNVTFGNISTGGSITATGNITGGNISTAGQVTVTGNVTAGNINGGANVNATTHTGSTVNVSGTITGGSLTVSTGSITGGNIINANANGVGNIGSSTTFFNTVFAKATSAQYADVAERFHADQIYDPGTVVELGGIAEITKSLQELSENVFGVISTNAAYLMNAGAGPDQTHPPIAVTGRVPVKVIGTVKKGDRLVSAGNGYARSAHIGEATAFNVIGRALENRSDTGEGTIEAIVTIK